MVSDMLVFGFLFGWGGPKLWDDVRSRVSYLLSLNGSGYDNRGLMRRVLRL